MNECRDTTVLGAGPVGMFAVFEAGMHDLSCHLVDALPQLGGQLAALYPHKPIYDLPGFPETSAIDFVQRLEAQMRPANPNLVLGDPVVRVEREEDGFVCHTGAGRRLVSRAVFIAAGRGAFSMRRPKVEDMDSYEGTSIFDTVEDATAWRGKRVVVQGGGDSALDWAVRLADAGCHVCLVHRRKNFRAHPKTVDTYMKMVARGMAEAIVPGVVRGVEGDAGVLHALRIGTPEGEQRIGADIWLPLLGVISQLGAIAEWGLDVSDGRIEVAAHSMESNRPGIYAMGDIASYPGKCSLILTGMAETAMAVRHAYRYCRPDGEWSDEYSTTRGGLTPARK